jgi:NHL repeat-containing protein
MTPRFRARVVRLATAFAGGLLVIGCSTLTPAMPGPSASTTGAATPAGTTPGPTATASVGGVHFDVGSIAFGPDGTLYGSACDAARVVKIGSGSPSVIAGSGPGGFAAGFKGDGHLATLAEMQCPVGLAVTPGGIFVADHGNNRVRFIDAQGLINTAAGSGPTGANTGSFSGDGGPAEMATLQEPTFLLWDGAGNLFISDRDNNRVRRIDPDGIITTVAGNGAGGFLGDDGPAATSSLDDPAGLAIDGRGNLYIADSNNNRIRRVDPKGRITTIAGTGVSSSTGDGGLATAATLADPEGLAIAPDGTLYVGEAAGNRIRKIAPDGTISTLAGTGAIGYTGDGGPAASATLAVSESEVGLTVDGLGNVYIPDLGNHCIRKVDLAGIITTFATT